MTTGSVRHGLWRPAAAALSCHLASSTPLVSNQRAANIAVTVNDIWRGKVAFFRGTSLRPVPPGASKVKDTRYLDIHESDELDEAQIAIWVKQAAALPGWVP